MQTQWKGQTLSQMLILWTDKNGNSTHAGENALDLQCKEWQPKCLDSIVYMELCFLHTAPAQSTYCWKGPNPFPSPSHPLPSRIWKAFQSKEGGKFSHEGWVWVTAMSRRTKTEIKCQTAWGQSHCRDLGQVGWHQTPHLDCGWEAKQMPAPLREQSPEKASEKSPAEPPTHPPGGCSQSLWLGSSLCSQQVLVSQTA